ncbi:MAG: hypothetical protein A2X42_01690 [Candidatus Margulisbacteria bacterium GWF2_38_17]|nr:MAG: hypothetical protein A2X42_01690 [Candidatus Margulisbacteria bacterium GWF2_38_17]OGI09380.1 MAG: hypothetical protein A2X41_09685 [Candidatus Margulisbacteria bacterium GWE2_39_32]
MNIKTVITHEQNIEKAMEDLKKQLETFNPKLVIYFASSIYSPQELSDKMQSGFTQAQTFGCSTSGELISGTITKNSIVLMALNDKIISDAKIEVIENLSELDQVKSAFVSFENYYKAKLNELDLDKYVGLILIDGLRGKEERIMEKIGALTNLTFVGGSAGDDLKFSQTYVFANGKSYTNAAILILLKTNNGFDILKTQSFNPLNKILKVTKANEAKREVMEFNNNPAIVEYAIALGKSTEEAKNSFMHNPIGLMIDGQPYVRSPQQAKDNSMVFYCNMSEGMELSLLEGTDIVNDTKKAIAAKELELGKITGIINFHCILRTLGLEDSNKSDEYGKIFTAIPTIGFSTYGEQYIGHMNQTSTMLLFK